MNPGTISGLALGGPAGLLSAWHRFKYLDFIVANDIRFYQHMRKTALFFRVSFRVLQKRQCMKISLDSFSSIVGNGRSPSLSWSWTTHLFIVLIEPNKYALTQESN